MYLVLFLHSLSVYVIIVSSDAVRDYYEECIGERCFMMPTLSVLSKTKAQAEAWCSKKSWTLASVNSQREQDDIDTFRFSLPREAAQQYFYIQSALRTDYRGYACWAKEILTDSAPGCDYAGISLLVYSGGYIPRSYGIYAHLFKHSTGEASVHVTAYDGRRSFICQYPKSVADRCPMEQLESEDKRYCFQKRDSELVNWFEARKRCLDSNGDLVFFGANVTLSWDNLWQWLTTGIAYYIGVRATSGTPVENYIRDFQYTFIYGSFNASACIILDQQASTWRLPASCDTAYRFICQTPRGQFSEESVRTTASGTVSSTSISTLSTAVVLNDIDTGNDNHMTDVFTMIIVPVAVIVIIVLIIAVFVFVVYKKKRSRYQASERGRGAGTHDYEVINVNPPAVSGSPQPTSVSISNGAKSAAKPVAHVAPDPVLYASIDEMPKRNTVASERSKTAPSKASSNVAADSILYANLPSAENNNEKPPDSTVYTSNAKKAPASEATPSQTVYASVVRKPPPGGTMEGSGEESNEYANSTEAQEPPSTVYAELTFVGDPCQAPTQQDGAFNKRSSAVKATAKKESGPGKKTKSKPDSSSKQGPAVVKKSLKPGSEQRQEDAGKASIEDDGAVLYAVVNKPRNK